jgi:hypothetical protein
MTTFALTWAALCRRPFSIASTVALSIVTAALLGAPLALALLGWMVTGLVSVKVWRTAERLVLRRFEARPPSRLERERLDLVPELAAKASSKPPKIEVLVVDRAEPWLRSGLRCLVISRGLLDLLEDRALVGLLSQAAREVPSANLAGEMLVWLSNVPLLSAWLFSRWLNQLGRLLAVAVGGSLVLPLLLWPVGFTRWAGRLFGSAIVGLVGVTLVSAGLAGAGLGLLLAWAIVPGLQWLVACETRRAEQLADAASIEAGQGWQLVEALETLMWADAVPAPEGVLGLLNPPGAPLAERADRVWQALSQT